jgi:hypothetical protein
MRSVKHGLTVIEIDNKRPGWAVEITVEDAN